MSDLLELAERCEKADGADRELDALIWITKRNARVEWRGNCLWIADNPNRPDMLSMFASIDPGEHQRNFSLSDRYAKIARYTASLDTAMSLVPEGLMFTITGGGPLGFHVLLAPQQGSIRDLKGYGGATLALAVCNAALRARALAREEDKG